MHRTRRSTRQDRGHHRIERQGFWAIADAFRNSAPGLMGRALPGPDDYEQIPALAERGRARTARFFEMLDRHLAGRRFVASDIAFTLPRYVATSWSPQRSSAITRKPLRTKALAEA